MLTNQLISTFVTRQASPSRHHPERHSTGLTVLVRKVLEIESKMENKTKVSYLKLLKHEKRGSKNEIWFEYQLDESLETNCRENLATLKKGCYELHVMSRVIHAFFKFFQRYMLKHVKA